MEELVVAVDAAAAEEDETMVTSGLTAHEGDRSVRAYFAAA